MMKVGDTVIRKNFKGGTGVIKSFSISWRGKQQARVEWTNALRTFKGGYSDNRTTLNSSALLIATSENLDKQQASKRRRRLKWAMQRWDDCKDWIYCSECNTRLINGVMTCYRCGPVTNIDRWIEGVSAKGIKSIIEGE